MRETEAASKRQRGYLAGLVEQLRRRERVELPIDLADLTLQEAHDLIQDFLAWRREWNLFEFGRETLPRPGRHERRRPPRRRANRVHRAYQSRAGTGSS